MSPLRPSVAGATLEAQSIRRFCEIVFGYLDGLVPVRLLPEAGTPEQKPRLDFPDAVTVADRLIGIAEWAAEQQRGVFVVPGTVERPGSARAADIVQTGVLVIDLDHGDICSKSAHLARYLGPASLQVASGGITDDGQAKLHLYWRLSEAAVGEDAVRVAELRGALAAKVGGDPAFKSLHQPIRVAGTIHGKNGRRTSVQILSDGQSEYHLRELAERIADMPPLPDLPVPHETGRQRGRRPRELAMARIAAGGQAGETRFDVLSKVIGHWIRNARRGFCTIDDAWVAVTEHNAAMIVPPWDHSCLRKEFDALLKKDIAQKGPLGGSTPHEHLQSRSIAPDLSDDAIAGNFAARHGQHWKHVPAWGAWYRWSGAVWERDETARVRELVRRVCRSAALQASKPADARHIASDRKMSAVLHIAAADPHIAVASSKWDAHPMLLNTPSGVVDLATGEISPHDPDLLLSQITAASPGAGCARWNAFLHEVTDGDGELQSYLARLAGYCLTGSTREQAFAFLHGHGANGKSVFLQVLANIMGSYAATATLETFMASKTERHLTELAGLRAARLVLVPETDAGRSWAEGRIKAVTGGEKLRANFMRRDHFEFEPQFKLVVAGNNRPALNGVGEAMRRRLHLVPFAVTIPAECRDPRLLETLLAERDGILGWMLAGCADWQRKGLAPPPSIRAAAEEYFEEEDLVGQWIEECCICGTGHTSPAAQLFQSWRAWAEGGGYPTGSQKALGEGLRARGFTPTTMRRQRGWAGIGVRSRSTPAEVKE